METLNKKEIASLLGMVNFSGRPNYETLHDLFIEKKVLDKIGMTEAQYTLHRRRFTIQESKIIKDVFMIAPLKKVA